MRHVLGQESERTRTNQKNLIAALNFESAFQNVERLVFPVCNVHRYFMMWRHDPFTESVISIGVGTLSLECELNALY